MKIGLLILTVLFLMTSCHTNSSGEENISSTDTTTTFPRAGITRVLDSMHQGFRTRNFKLMESFLTEDGLYLGTDPSEIWSKKQLSQYFNTVKDTTNLSYSILSRTILLGKNANTALAIEQYYLSAMSDKMMVRSISKLIKQDDHWKISFYSWNFIPRNEDIKKLNSALQ